MKEGGRRKRKEEEERGEEEVRGEEGGITTFSMALTWCKPVHIHLYLFHIML